MEIKMVPTFPLHTVKNTFRLLNNFRDVEKKFVEK